MSATAIQTQSTTPALDAAFALDMFGRGVRAAYDGRLVRMVLFGSQARGEADAESDFDVAVVLDEVVDKAAERLRLSDIAYEAIVETAVEVQAWAVSEREWADPEAHRNPSLVRAMKRDGIVLWSNDDLRPAGQGIAFS